MTAHEAHEAAYESQRYAADTLADVCRALGLDADASRGDVLAAIERLRAPTCVSGDGVEHRGDIVFSRGYRAGRAEAQAAADRMQAERVDALAAHAHTLGAVERVSERASAYRVSAYRKVATYIRALPIDGGDR